MMEPKWDSRIMTKDILRGLFGDCIVNQCQFDMVNIAIKKSYAAGQASTALEANQRTGPCCHKENP